MATNFISSGSTTTIAYAGNTAGFKEVSGAQAIRVFNPDATNPIIVATSFIQFANPPVTVTGWTNKGSQTINDANPCTIDMLGMYAFNCEGFPPNTEIINVNPGINMGLAVPSDGSDSPYNVEFQVGALGPTADPANIETGNGTIVGPGQTLILTITTQYASGPLYVSVAGISESGNVYVTPGVIQ